MIEHATSSNSVGHVVNHEQRHIAEFESRAQARDLEIIKEDISLSYQFIDGKIVAVAGRATAVAREKATDQNQVSQAESYSNISAKSAYNKGSIDDPPYKINQLMHKVESALATIENRLEGLSAATGADQSENSSVDKVRLEMKKRKLEAKLAELKSTKLEITQKEILGGLSEIIGDAANLLGATYALKSGNENYGSSDKYSKIEVPDYPMQYAGLMLDTMI